jgi:3-hydroxyisobutyrate dehydrogenase
MKIGFIGLGNMGAPMAANLAAAGHDVTGFDVAGISLANGETAASAVAAATGRDVVITMLPVCWRLMPRFRAALAVRLPVH